jgi:hypothetical protein
LVSEAEFETKPMRRTNPMLHETRPIVLMLHEARPIVPAKFETKNQSSARQARGPDDAHSSPP